MKFKPLFLYIIGVVLLVFGNRELWDELQEARELKEKQQALAEANNKVKKEIFETQKLQYDSINKKWNNPEYYFQVINAGSPNFKALKKKGNTKVETNTDEDASDSQ